MYLICGDNFISFPSFIFLSGSSIKFDFRSQFLSHYFNYSTPKHLPSSLILINFFPFSVEGDDEDVDLNDNVDDEGRHNHISSPHDDDNEDNDDDCSGRRHDKMSEEDFKEVL